MKVIDGTEPGCFGSDKEYNKKNLICKGCDWRVLCLVEVLNHYPRKKKVIGDDVRE